MPNDNLPNDPQATAAASSAPESSPPPAATNRAPVDAGTYAQYLLHARSEIEFILERLHDDASQITMFFNEGKDMLLTAVVAIEEDDLILDFGASMDTNRKAVAADRLFCVTQHDKVRIQFILRGIERVEYQGQPAFRTRIPDEVLRLQRREFYRLTMPVTRPLKCTLAIPEASGAVNTLELNIVDISGGGLGLSLPDTMSLNHDTIYRGCKFELPEIGSVSADLRLRSQFDIVLKSGARVRRAGCEFVKPAGPMLTLIQRYIIKVERERKARESGLI